MGKRKLIYIFLTMLILFALILALGKSLLGDSDSAVFRIFELTSEGQHLYKQFAIVPETFRDKFEEEILESSNSSSLIKLKRNDDPIGNSFLILRKKDRDLFLRAYPIQIFDDHFESNINVFDSLTYLIDLDVFNKYLVDFELYEDKEIIEKYLQFLSLSNSVKRYVIIDSYLKIDSVIQQFPLVNKNELSKKGNKLVDPKLVSFNESRNKILCWFVNFGLVEFDFTFKDQKLVLVKSKKIGFLGNEYPTCC